MQGGVRGGGVWKATGGFFHALGQKCSHCVLKEVQKGTQCTCQTEIVTALALVCPSGTIHSTPYSGLSLIYKSTSMIPDPAICSSINGLSA